MPKLKKKVGSTTPTPTPNRNMRIGLGVLSGLFIISFLYYGFVMFLVESLSTQYGTRITMLEAQHAQLQQQIMALTAKVQAK